MVKATQRPHYSRQRDPVLILHTRPGGPHGRNGRVRENFAPHRPARSDCAIPAHYVFFVWISEQPTIIFPHNINVTGFDNRGSVYCAIRTASIKIMCLDVSIQQPFHGSCSCRRPPTAEARIRSQVSLCEICGGKSSTGTRFSHS